MKKIVLSYLSRHYELDISEVKNDGIYAKDYLERPRPPKYYDRLLSELVAVFSIHEEYLKLYINEWAVGIKPDIDLKWYWSATSTFSDFNSPIVRQVFAGTIANELVSVQPMAAPSLKYLGLTPTTTQEDEIKPTRPRRISRETIHERWGDVINILRQNEDDFFNRRNEGPYE